MLEKQKSVLEQMTGWLKDTVNYAKKFKDEFAQILPEYLISHGKNRKTIIMIVNVHSSNKDKIDAEYKLDAQTLPTQGDWKIKMLVVESKNKEILNAMQFKLVGDYLCYRHDEEMQLNIRKLENIKNLEHIKLDHIYEADKRLKKHTTFDKISQSSSLHYRLNEYKLPKEQDVDKDLIDVVIGNQSYVYDLNEPGMGAL